MRCSSDCELYQCERERLTASQFPWDDRVVWKTITNNYWGLNNINKSSQPHPTQPKCLQMFTVSILYLVIESVCQLSHSTPDQHQHQSHLQYTLHCTSVQSSPAQTRFLSWFCLFQPQQWGRAWLCRAGLQSNERCKKWNFTPAKIWRFSPPDRVRKQVLRQVLAMDFGWRTDDNYSSQFDNSQLELRNKAIKK